MTDILLSVEKEKAKSICNGGIDFQHLIIQV